MKTNIAEVIESVEESDLWKEYEKIGYNSWLNLWVLWGVAPRASECPARYMKDGSIQRRACIRGWTNAAKEAMN